MSNRETWLNGWKRDGWNVELGNSTRCAGCGKVLGVTTVAIPADYVPSSQSEPEWPFNEVDCPICENRSSMGFDALTERALRYKKASGR